MKPDPTAGIKSIDHSDAAFIALVKAQRMYRCCDLFPDACPDPPAYEISRNAPDGCRMRTIVCQHHAQRYCDRNGLLLPQLPAVLEEPDRGPMPFAKPTALPMRRL
jgi:hypothetical protein